MSDKALIVAALAIIVIFLILVIASRSVRTKGVEFDSMADVQSVVIEDLEGKVATLQAQLEASQKECIHYVECLEGKHVTYTPDRLMFGCDDLDNLFLMSKSNLLRLKNSSYAMGQKDMDEQYKRVQLELPFFTDKTYDRDYADFTNYGRDVCITYKNSPQLRTVLSRLTHEFRTHLDARRQGKHSPFRFIV